MLKTHVYILLGEYYTMFKRKSVLLLLFLFFTPSLFAQEELTQEELEKLEGYGSVAYFVYLGTLLLLGVGVLIAALLIQNNLGTKNMLIYAGIIVLIASIIMYY